MAALSFQKMHGLGNDFVVVDARPDAFAVSAGLARRLADRRRGVGCDQVLVLERSPRADAFMRVLNADGSEAGACGNGTRCIGRLLMAERGTDAVTIETAAGVLAVRRAEGGYAVDMGRPRFGWDEIPLARPMATEALDLALGPLSAPAAVNLGNPHAVFFVADVEAVPLAELGPTLEAHALFPERANIGVAEVRGRATIRLRVFERGVGITAACGSGACAALVTGARRGLTGRRAEVVLDGGTLEVAWTEDDRVLMTGPATLTFSGDLTPEVLAEPA